MRSGSDSEVGRARADMEQVLRAYPHLIPHITKCIERAVRKERERCAKIGDGAVMTAIYIGPLFNAGWNEAVKWYAARIRGREEK